MSNGRINVPLDSRELRALIHMAQAECRHPREQARYLLREALREHGSLPADTQQSEGAHHEPEPQRAA